MAPEKIYLQHNTKTDLYDEFWPEWFESTHHPERDICYIRKDALLEKLNRARELRIKGGQKESSDGIRVIDALTNLINRL